MTTFTLGKLVLYFFRLGATVFGGSVALISHMERELVEQKKWLSKDEFIDGVALSQLAPGPFATQMTIYVGFIRGGVIGATVGLIAFILPSFMMCVGLAGAYVYFGSLPWIHHVLYGVGAAVIGIMAYSGFRLTTKIIDSDWTLFVLWAVSAVLTPTIGLKAIWLFLLSGLVVLFLKTPPKISKPGTFCSVVPLWQIATFFTKSGAFVFGSGLAIIPFLHGGAVEKYKWLTEQQFMDAVAVAMITPGPIIITVSFMGYLIAGLMGAIVATAGTLLPCYLFTIILVPHYTRLTKYPRAKAFVQGVTVAAIGAIAGGVWMLGKRAIIDIPTLIIMIVALSLVAKARIPEPIIVIAAGIAGLCLGAYSQ